MIELLEANQQLLTQAAALCRGLDAATFSQLHVTAPGGTVGAHMRHCIEHYDCLLSSTVHHRLDYAHRQRNERLETDPPHAAERLDQIRTLLPERFAAIKLSTPLTVRSDAADVWLRSSYGRELQFLASHTVHHFALIAILVRLSGIELPSDFGVAPSTLKFRTQQAPCAA